jgi:uncharacterized Zn-binding protein involved in type VI secretion
MSGLPAARQTDPVAHPDAGGNILTGSPNVRINGLPAARVGDMVQHDNGICVITEGEPTVRINGLPAARVTDATSCGGHIVSGSPNVRIGRAHGKVIGYVGVGMKMCQNAAKGRNLKTQNRKSRNLIPTQQSYSNCAIESARQIINQATPTNVSEDNLLQYALDNGQANYNGVCKPVGTPPTSEDGGADAYQVQALLSDSGVPSVTEDNNLNNISQALTNGQGVMASVDANVLWKDIPGIVHPPPGSGHEVTVTGLVYDDKGNVTAVIINDTGTGDCSKPVPVDTWNKAVQGLKTKILGTNPPQYYGNLINVTKNKIF